VVLDGPRELLGGILPMSEPLPRPARVGVRPQVDIGVAQKRQNRVIERGRRDLDLPPCGRRPVLRNDAVQDLELDLPESGLVVLRKAASELHQAPDARVGIQIQRIDPGQLLPDLKVPKIVHVVGRSASGKQVGVARIDVDHPLPLSVEKVGANELDLGRGQIDRRLETELERPIPRAIFGERLELDEEGRHEVEGHLHVGKLPQERHHPVVVLERVQPHPRQDVLPRREVFIERLMHVPENGDAGHTV